MFGVEVLTAPTEIRERCVCTHMYPHHSSFKPLSQESSPENVFPLFVTSTVVSWSLTERLLVLRSRWKREILNLYFCTEVLRKVCSLVQSQTPLGLCVCKGFCSSRTWECRGDAVSAGDAVKNTKPQSGRGEDDVDYSGFECRDSAVNVAELVTGSGDYGRYITSAGDKVQRRQLWKTTVVDTLPGCPLPGWPQRLSEMGSGKSPVREGTL